LDNVISKETTPFEYSYVGQSGKGILKDLNLPTGTFAF
jgi:hypothetical protein